MKFFRHRLKKPTKRQVMRFLLNSIIILLGNGIAAAATAFFIEPMGFSMGGTSGLGIYVRNLLGAGIDGSMRKWVVNLVVYGANIILFIIGVIALGRKFAAGTLAGTILYPGFMSLYNLLDELYADRHGGLSFAHTLGDPMLCCVIGGLLFGFGIAIVVRVGASTGGTDIPPLIFQKYFGTPVSMSLWLLDGAIIALEFTVPNFAESVGIQSVIYGVLITLIAALVIGKVSPIGMRRTQVKIISEHYLEIRDMILNKISRGVTVLYGQTGYLKQDCHMLLTIISHRQLVALKAEVEKIDPRAFMTISVVSEVRGLGFHSDGVDFLMPQEKEETVPPVADREDAHEKD